MKKNFDIDYYKNADLGIHVQCIENSSEAIKPHTHNYYQIYYILRGTLCHVTDCDSLTLTRGDMFIIPPGREHHIENVENALFYTFSFTPDSLNLTDVGSPAKHFLIGLESGEIKARVTVPDDEILLIEDIMEKMLREFSERRVGYEDVLRSYAVILLTVLARNYYRVSDSFPQGSDSRSMILYSVEYIKSNFADELTLDLMCRKCAMSKSSFCKLFLSVTGMSFKAYLNSCRVREAVKYVNKGYSIGGIYALVGFNDFTAFYRNFRRIMGCSPMEFRRCAENGEKSVGNFSKGSDNVGKI